MKQLSHKNKTLFVPERYFHSNLTDRFKNDCYEKEEVQLATKYFNKTDNVLELGSCLGFLACVLSDCCNIIISVEANPELEGCLELTKTENMLVNVEFVNGYLDSIHREIDFQTYDNIVAGSGDREDNGRGWGDSLKLYKINTITLEDIPNVSKINVLLIDIEGGELNFLETHREFIRNKINKICIELHGHLMKGGSNFNNKCIKLMESLGFKLIERLGCSYYYEKNN